jgi:hypothetical protein
VLDGGRVIEPAPAPGPALAGPPIPPEWHGARLDGHWRAAIAWWPVEWRRKWADRAEAHQDDGCAWDVAEYWAWRQTLGELDQVEARCETIAYREPDPGLSDEDAVAKIAGLTWDEPRSVPWRTRAR